MIRGIVFDLDHTLFDRYETLKLVVPEFYRQYRDKIPVDLSEQQFIEHFIAIEKRYIHFGWGAIFRVFAEEGIMFRLSEEEMVDARNYLLGHCWHLAAVKFPFTEPTLIKLREQGYKLGIITNGPKDCQTRKMQLIGICELMDEIIICSDKSLQKPSVKPFIQMSERLGIPPEELVYVGDNPLNDVEASRNAGYLPVWVKTTGFWCFDEIERAPFEIETVEELPELLKAIHKK